MKLRFRANSLRLRVNQKEVDALINSRTLSEEVEFPGNACLTYALGSERIPEPQVTFVNCNIEITVPRALVLDWANSEEIGVYFSLPTANEPLKVAIEKDLVCVDGREDERDPDAFPREAGEKVC